MAIILGTPSPRARVAEWRAQARLRANLVVSFANRLTTELRRAGREAAQGFAAGGDQGLDMALAAHTARLRELLGAEHRRALMVFGERLLDAVKGSGLILETKDARSSYSRAVEEWVGTFGAAQVVKVGDSTKRGIVRAVRAGQAEGEGIPGIGKRIRERTSGTIGRTRALVIARTEVHAASQAAAQEAQLALDLPAKREWITAQDNRTRDTHREADRQIRDQDKPFDVGGAKLRYPGDPNGPAAEVINCALDGELTVETINGSVPIKVIRPGDLVLTHKGRYRRVIRVRPEPRYSGVAVTLRTVYGQICVTAAHPFQTRTGWDRADALQIGDSIRVLVSATDI